MSVRPRETKILFVWTGVTSYMADCWRRLRQADGIELKVVVERADSGKAFDAAETFKGLDCTVVSGADASTGPDWRAIVAWRPDVVFAGGWRSPTTRRMLAALPDVPKVFCLDMPWRLSVRCLVARFALWRFLRRFDAAFVPGASSRRYARWLGFPAKRIFTRLYAVDAARLRMAADAVPPASRRGFLFVGRYSSEKRVDLVEKAYAEYRRLGGAWSIDYYGQGGQFVQPGDMPKIYAEHACLLLASAFDPWPLVALEARIAGLDVIASDHCGNVAELDLRRVPFGDVAAMAREMLAVERAGRQAADHRTIVARETAAAYDCGAWAERVRDICASVMRRDLV